MADLYRAEGKLRGATALYEQSVRILEVRFGSGNPLVKRELQALAEIYRAQGRNVEASRSLRRIPQPNTLEQPGKAGFTP